MHFASTFLRTIDCPSRPRLGRAAITRAFARAGALLSAAILSAGCGGSGEGSIIPPQEVGAIVINTPSFTLERGSYVILTANVYDIHGQKLDVPVAWSSSNEKAASFQPGGKLVAGDSGTTAVVASTLGKQSQPVSVQVVWQGPAKLSRVQWTAPNAATPAATVGDSIRVRVTNPNGASVSNAKVKWAVTAGNGSISSTNTRTDPNGLVAVQWTLGLQKGPNSITATVVDQDDKPITWVDSNATKFSVTSYDALVAVDGDGQTAQILSALPVVPSVRLVDSLGKPRVGIPLTFTATQGGRVAITVVSTASNGVASPGTWTLGDIPGQQKLIVSVEAAKLELKASATGTPIHYRPASGLIASGFVTCALDASGLASCMGQEPQVGDGDTLSKFSPTPTAGSIAFKSLSPSRVTSIPTHVCGISSDNAVYCWGANALVDTSGKTNSTRTPTKLGSDLTWAQVSAGGAHNCAVTLDGIAYCWGVNSIGQLGIRSDTGIIFKPAPVYGDFRFLNVAAGASHTCGLTLDRTALCWGNNAFGQLGDGGTIPRLAPTLVGGGVTFQSIDVGDPWSCGLSTTGKVYCWGGVEGLGVTTSPHLYAGAPTFTSLTVGSLHACALTGDGLAYCWGNNQFGQLGDSSVVSRANPTPVTGGLRFTSLAAGVAHTCGVTTDGSVACWGSNLAGELGDKNAAIRITPRYVVLGVTP
jgi:regulator of chromosome condensation (RCC1) repeat-containing protein/Regulator of Chromosome Condensation (RCC1) repeat protein